MTHNDVELPVAQLTDEEWHEWQALKEELEALKPKFEREMELRKKIAAYFFHGADLEGTQKQECDGLTIVANFKINREIDPIVLQQVSHKLAELNVNANDLIRWKPELKTAEYRKLSPEAKVIFDEAVTEKPGAPSLTIKYDN